MPRLAVRCSAAGLVAGLAGAGQLEAAGYALKEQSLTAQGNAFAGASSAAEDVSFMFFNPAALGWVEEIEMQATATIVAPRTELKSASASTVTGSPITGRDDESDVTPDAVLPAFYVGVPLPGEVRVGLGINTPFGLKTEYSDTWVGRYHGITSKLKTVDVNPAVAWRPVNWLSIGAGFQAQYADGTLTNAIDFGTIGAANGIPGALPGQQDGFANLNGDDWAYGWTAGTLVEPVAGTRIGLGYRSEVRHTLRGDVDFSEDAAGIANLIRGASGAFTDSDAEVELTTPASLSFGIHQDLTDRFAVMAEAQWTQWSVFDELKVEFDNPAQPDSVTEEEWHDAWFLAVGATYKPADQLTLRGGLAFDESPVKDKFRTPRIPDENRYWFSLGADWRPSSWFDLDAAFTYIILDDAEVDLTASDPNNRSRGNLIADYDASFILLGLSARLRF